MKPISLILLAVLLAGCATGVKMTDAEAEACRAVGCTVWTDQELRGLAMEFMRRGYLQGAQSRGKEL